MIDKVKEKYPEVPLIFHANGGVGKLAELGEVRCDVLGLDWSTNMGEARAKLGADKVLQVGLVGWEGGRGRSNLIYQFKITWLNLKIT